ncbi:hypothetical protein OG444_40185 (plasmid) [Streptomyces sp. NBC_01232]|uniref:hypothetical protein n=1 Tax=Streptomyces sp. NBC_01232 TaxID=2903786 RepID=UPI002E10894D|nr:hypothetical protein OG444_40185 [Streptomyces sp. NBC_01232]
MPTERFQRISRALVLLCALLSFLSAGATLSIAVAADDPKYHATVGPPDPIPKEWEQETVGLDPKGKYCLVDRIDDRALCRRAEAGELPGTLPICEGADGNGARDCSPEDQSEAEIRRLEEWRKAANKQAKNYEKLNEYMTDCVVNRKIPFTACRWYGEKKFPEESSGLLDWVAGKFSEFASNALKEAASYIGKSVVWLLSSFAEIFNDTSSIDLSKTGVGKVTAMMTSLSAVLAVFLLLIQFGKVTVSHDGGPAATALLGLGKWAVISSVYLLVAQTALDWSDVVSTWIINKTFEGGGSGDDGATKAMQDQLGTLFGGLITGGGGTATVGGALIAGETVATSAVGVIIVMGIVCILAIAALWVEMLMRQVGIVIIIATMPITLAGQLSDATAEWWPKARNAFTALVLMKPAIVTVFSIGFFAMAEGKGVQNMLVGFVMFLAACFCWPVLAKFMTFTTNGAGSSMASGWISAIGSSASSSSGGYRPDPSGAGAVGGGVGYTKALEAENSTPAAAPAASGGVGGAVKSAARFGGKAMGVAAFGLQVVAAGKDSLESGLSNTAAHAGLDQGAGGGRHVVIAPRRGGGPAPAPIGAPSEVPPDPQPVPAPSANDEG